MGWIKNEVKKRPGMICRPTECNDSDLNYIAYNLGVESPDASQVLQRPAKNDYKIKVVYVDEGRYGGRDVCVVTTDLKSKVQLEPDMDNGCKWGFNSNILKVGARYCWAFCDQLVPASTANKKLNKKAKKYLNMKL